MRKTVIIVICLIEIAFMSPRTFSYIVIDLLPYRIFSLPLVTFSFLVTMSGYFVIELLSHRYLLNRLIKFRIAIFVWLIFMTISALRNPLRDVFFESQGMLIFMVSVIIFGIASIYLGKMRKILIWGIFLSIAITVFILNFILLTNPALLPTGYAQDDIRYEGLYSSTPIMALVAISTAFIFMYKKIVIKLTGVAGILISISGLVMTATRSAMAASLLTFAVVVFYSVRTHKSFNKILLRLIPILLVMLLLIANMSRWFPMMEGNIDYVISRFSMLGESHSDQSRLDEALQEMGLFLESPIIGHGYGLLNKYSVDGWGTVMFGHNFLTSLLARTGLVGLIVIIWYGFNLQRKLATTGNISSVQEAIIAKGALSGALLLILISNFSGFQTFGIYGALAGIASGATMESKFQWLTKDSGRG